MRLPTITPKTWRGKMVESCVDMWGMIQSPVACLRGMTLIFFLLLRLGCYKHGDQLLYDEESDK